MLVFCFFVECRFLNEKLMNDDIWQEEKKPYGLTRLFLQRLKLALQFSLVAIMIDRSSNKSLILLPLCAGPLYHQRHQGVNLQCSA